jgi:mannosyltransferase
LGALRALRGGSGVGKAISVESASGVTSRSFGAATSATTIVDDPLEVASRPPVRATRLRIERRHLLFAAFAAVVLAGIVLRFVAGSDLWLDEAMSVNIARLPLGRMHDALRQDGAPPLYYVLLHFWIKLFGSGDFAVRSLSGVLSVATLPAAWFAGREIGGRRLAWIATLVLAVSPFAILYGTETRMYSLVMLLVMWGYVALRRALAHPSVGRLAIVAAITALLVYAHYWTLYLLAVVAAGLMWRAVRAQTMRDRQTARLVLGGLAVGALGFAFWLGTFRYQLAHTGTPWAGAILPWEGVTATLRSFAGVAKHGEAPWLMLVMTLLIIAALFGRVAGHHIDLDAKSRPGVRIEAAVALVTLVAGLVLSWFAATAFASRYTAVIIPLVVLVVAYGVTVFPNAKTRFWILTVIVAFGLAGGVSNALDERTQAYQGMNIVGAEAHAGDVVVYCPDQIAPDASRLLDGVPTLHEIAFPDGATIDRVNWVDYLRRVRGTSTKVFAHRVLERAGPDHTIWFEWAPGYHNLQGRCEGLAAALSEARPGRTRVTPKPQTFFEHQGLIEFPPARDSGSSTG